MRDNLNQVQELFNEEQCEKYPGELTSENNRRLWKPLHHSSLVGSEMALPVGSSGEIAAPRPRTVNVEHNLHFLYKSEP